MATEEFVLNQELNIPVVSCRTVVLERAKRSGLKLVGMIGKTMVATLGENHAEGFSAHGNYCNKESLHHPLQLPNYQFTITFKTRTNVEFTTEPQMGYNTC